MSTECFTKQIEFQGLGQRKVVADFSAGYVTSDAGSLLLTEVDKKRGILQTSCLVEMGVTNKRKLRLCFPAGSVVF